MLAVLTALVAALTGLAVLPPTAASADDPADLAVNVTQGNLQAQAGGQPTSLVFTVTNNGPATSGDFIANVTIPLGDKGVYLASSSPNCNQNGGPTVLACPVDPLETGQSKIFTLVIGPPPAGSLAATDSFSGQGGIQLTDSGNDPNGANDTGQFTLSVTGAPTAVTQITGSVTDASTSQPAVGANVVSRDANGTTCSATTDASGAFTCSPNPGLAGGQITIEATMPGFQLSRTVVTPTNGAVTVQLALTPAPSASPSPSAAAPSSPAAVASTQPQALKSGGGFPWDTVLLIIGIAIALAALGGGAWWIYRRKDRDPDPNGPRPDLPDLVGAETLLPTMPMRMPNMSETTVASPPLYGQHANPRPELAAPVSSGAPYGMSSGGPSGPGNSPTAVWGAPVATGADNGATAVWGAPGVSGNNASGNNVSGNNWAPANGSEQGWGANGTVNRSTEPIPVSGGAPSSGAGWSSGADPDSNGESTAAWPTVEPASAPPAGLAPTSAAPGSAFNEPTARYSVSAPPPQYSAGAPTSQFSVTTPSTSPGDEPTARHSMSAPSASPINEPTARHSASAPPASDWSTSPGAPTEGARGEDAPSTGAQPRSADRYYPGEQQAEDSTGADPFSWGVARPRGYAPAPDDPYASALPSEAPNSYERPGMPLAGWDTPPAVSQIPPSSPAPSENSAPFSSPRLSGSPIPPAPPGPPPTAPWNSQVSSGPNSAPPWNSQPASAPPWSAGAPQAPASAPPWSASPPQPAAPFPAGGTPSSAPPWQPSAPQAQQTQQTQQWQQTPPPAGYPPAGSYSPPPAYPSAPGQSYPVSGPSYPTSGPAYPPSEPSGPSYPTSGPTYPTSGPAYSAPGPVSPPSGPAYPTSGPAYPVSGPTYPTAGPTYPPSGPSYPASGPSYPASGPPIGGPPVGGPPVAGPPPAGSYPPPTPPTPPQQSDQPDAQRQADAPDYQWWSDQPQR